MLDPNNYPSLAAWLMAVYTEEGEQAAKKAIDSLTESQKIEVLKVIEDIPVRAILQGILSSPEKKPWERPWHNGILN